MASGIASKDGMVPTGSTWPLFEWCVGEEEMFS